MLSSALAFFMFLPSAGSQPAVQNPGEDVRILAGHTTKRPIDAKQQGQFIELLCNLIPSIIAQQVVSTSFEDAPPCRVAYKREVDEPYRPWYPDGAVRGRAILL